jgi:hypothetical protein
MQQFNLNVLRTIYPELPCCSNINITHDFSKGENEGLEFELPSQV